MKINMADWEEYFSKQTAPANLKETKTVVAEFAATHRNAGRNVVLMTVSEDPYFGLFWSIFCEVFLIMLCITTGNFTIMLFKHFCLVYIINLTAQRLCSKWWLRPVKGLF